MQLHHRLRVFPITQPVLPIKNRVWLKSMAWLGTDHYLEAYGIATKTLVENLGLDTPTLRDWQFPCSFPTRNEVTELLEVMAASSRIILRMCLMDIRLNLGNVIESFKYGLLNHNWRTWKGVLGLVVSFRLWSVVSFDACNAKYEFTWSVRLMMGICRGHRVACTSPTLHRRFLPRCLSSDGRERGSVSAGIGTVFFIHLNSIFFFDVILQSILTFSQWEILRFGNLMSSAKRRATSASLRIKTFTYHVDQRKIWRRLNRPKAT